jgi:putative DNA primase/helicase
MFDRITRPKVKPTTVTLDELVQLLTRFEVLGDKRDGRCWSPTQYTDGETSRSNAGVTRISALVFDLDRMLPDTNRLIGVCWIGHTTWSHRPDAPRWRVVIPLAMPAESSEWSHIWRRARAVFCPEADPACKDPSRAYWLPSSPAGIVPVSSYHPGPLLDAVALPTYPKSTATRSCERHHDASRRSDLGIADGATHTWPA